MFVCTIVCSVCLGVSVWCVCGIVFACVILCVFFVFVSGARVWDCVCVQNYVFVYCECGVV